jgi:hypothetical protein
MDLRTALAAACMLVFAGCEPGTEPDDERVKPGSYTVTAPELVLHASLEGEPLGRLYRGQTMDVHHVEPDGWALGSVVGAAQPCVWARFLDSVPSATIYNFDERAIGPVAVDGACEPPELDAPAPDRSAFASRLSDDGEDGTAALTDCDRSDYWKNWDWEAGAGLGPSDGVLDRDTEVWWRYVTIDGNGVMARTGDDRWVFIARPCVPL